MHSLLPTEARLTRILRNTSGNCKICPTPVTADLTHCFFECISTKEVGRWLLSIARKQDPSVTASKLLKLEIIAGETAEMPIIWITAQVLLYMWGVRASGKTVSLILTRATLESRISILRETIYIDEHADIK